MNEIEKIIRAVDSSMRMEGMPLSAEDKRRIEECLKKPEDVSLILQALIDKHTVKITETERG